MKDRLKGGERLNLRLQLHKGMMIQGMKMPSIPRNLLRRVH